MKKATFLIDGFNFYYSILDLMHKKRIGSKWINLFQLCKTLSNVPVIKAGEIEVHYFTALPNHFQNSDPDKIKRHKKYINALKANDVNIALGRFKKKWPRCKNCHTNFLSHEEKETDVSLAIKLVELCYENASDTIVIISGDTDFAPAVKFCRNKFPNIQILFAFPYKKKHFELQHICPQSFPIFENNYKSHNLLDPVVTKEGRTITKPKDW